jgi:CHU_C Type IX secretion signal domain/SprB repeat
MRNFLIFGIAFFGLLIVSGSVNAQCPVQANVVTKTHTNISCFGANDGTITVDLADASTSEPFNFELVDLSIPAIVTLSVTENENKTGRSVIYSNVPPGSYAVGFFKSGCPTLQITDSPFGFEITEPAEIIATATITPDCGSGNGKIDISITGGVAPYTSIIWTGPTAIPNGTTNTAANLVAGSYSVTITDNTSCSITENYSVPVTTPANAGPPTGVTCGTNSFALSGNAFGAGEIGTWTGPPGVTFSPNANTPTATANNLAVGNNVLTWTITDVGFVCPGTSDNITVTYSDVSISGSADVALPCFGATTGSGTFTVTGGSGNYSYAIIPPNVTGATITLPPPGPTTSVSFTNAGVGSITLQVTNNGCTDQVTINITQPSAAVSFTSTVTNPTCALGSNGSILVTPAGGVSPYSFSMDGGATYPVSGSTHTFSGLGAGTYSLRVRDANSCESAVQPVSVINPGGFTFTTVTTPPSCFGGSNGIIQITLVTGGGTGPFSFSIDGGATYPLTDPSTQTFTGLPAGSYNVRVKDANGCETVNVPRTLTAPTQVTFTQIITDASCAGGNDGSIQISPSGGTGPYSFSIDGGTSYPVTNPSAHTFTGLAAGSYNLRVRDIGNCETAVIPVTVAGPAAMVLTPTTVNTTCFGGSDGSIQISVSGGVSPYSFSIDGGASYPATNPSVHTFTGLTTGSYNIRVRDANLCETSVMPISVGQSAAITSTPVVTDVSCFGGNDGSIEITPVNGTSPYSFSLDGGFSYPVTNPSIHTFTGLLAGSYNIRIRDVNNCESAILPVTVNQSSVVNVMTTPVNATCFGGSNGSILVTPSGGVSPYDFSIDGGASYPIVDLTGHTFTGLTAGNYNIRVRDANGCETAVIVTAVGQAVDITFSPVVVNATCFNGTDGSISISPSGGTSPYDFSIDGGSSYPATDLAANTFTGLTAQNYNLRVRDANGCESSVFVQAVGASSPVTINTTSTTPATCAGLDDGVINVTGVTGGNGTYQYSINSGANFQASASFTGLAPGNYDVVVIDGNNCGSAPVTVSVGSGLVYDVSATSTPASCGGVNDGTVTVNSTTGGVAPFQYSIDGGALQTSATFTGQGVGNHSVTAVDANGCISNTFDVVVGSGVTISSTNTPSAVTVCLGSDGSVDISGITGGTAPYDLSIDNGATFPVTDVTTNTFTGLTAGNYNVVIRDNSGCLSMPALVTVSAPAGCVLNCFAYTVVVDQTLTKRPSCNGGNDGVIALIVTGNPGNIEVSLIPSLAPTEIRPSGSTFVFSNLSEGTYQYQIFDGSNICVQPFTWNNAQDIAATASAFQDSPCFGTPSGSAVIDATGSATGQYFYSVDGTAWTEFVPGNVVNGLPGNGTYNVRVGGAVNDPCYDEVSVTINTIGTALLDTVYVSPVNGFPAVSFPESPTATRIIGIEESGAAPYEVRLQLVDPYGITPNPPFIVDWIVVDGTNPQSFIPQKQLDALYAGEYQLSLRDAVGCEKTYSFIIDLDERIFIPNIFTPNKSDNLNSTFFVRNLPGNGSKLQVTDRWGKEVYSSNNYNPETLWDGGESPDGVYFYRLQIKGGKTYTGWVEILRGTKP